MGTQYDAKTVECYNRKEINVEADQEEMMLTSTWLDAKDKCGDLSP